MMQARIVPDLIGAWAKEKYPTDLTHKFVKVDKLDFLINKLEALKSEVEEKQLAASLEYVGTAFVTFRYVTQFLPPCPYWCSFQLGRFWIVPWYSTVSDQNRI